MDTNTPFKSLKSYGLTDELGLVNATTYHYGEQF